MTSIRDISSDCELKLRGERLRGELRKIGADALLVSSNVNLLYSCGEIISGFVYIPVEGSELIFVRRPKGLEGERIRYIHKVEDIPATLREEGVKLPSRLAVEADALSYSEYMRVAASFPESTLVNGSPLLRSVRGVKSAREIELIRESGVKHAEMYARVSGLYREGMTDNDLSIEIERVARSLGSLGIFRIAGSSMEIFMGSILTGDNADNPSPYDFALGGAGMDVSLPVGANGTILRKGMAILVDIAGNFTGYMTDMSRVFAVEELTDRDALRAHHLSIEIQDAILSVAKPGVEAKALYELAIGMVEREGLAPYFMGHRQQAGFIGHGVGMEINELPVISPRSKDILTEGMVFALEPKFVIPGVGAVGTENTYLVTSDGLERVTNFSQEIQIFR